MAKLHSIFTAALEEHKVSTKACTLIPHREVRPSATSLYLGLLGLKVLVSTRGEALSY